jgi:hypothetical protein
MIKTQYGETFRGERITLDRDKVLYVGCSFFGCAIVAAPNQDGYGLAGCTFIDCTFEGVSAEEVMRHGRP